MFVTIFTDGSSLGNPGPGGFGAILKYVGTEGKEYVLELSEGYRLTTNNRMELMAVIKGLEALTKPCEVMVYSDSKYVVDAFNQHWIDSWIKKGFKKDGDFIPNTDLWKRLLEAKLKHKVNFTWLKGHAGHEENERCDELAKEAAGSGKLLIDEEYEKKLEVLIDT